MTNACNATVFNAFNSRGALIVLEGLDRCGKTSQVQQIALLPKRLDDHAIHLLFSAYRWEKRSLMESKVRTRTTLIVERYSFSGDAFSSYIWLLKPLSDFENIQKQLREIVLECVLNYVPTREANLRAMAKLVN
ncbi:hypothetical protein ACJIZ3_018316 [Penstemon smallii]|uniref:Thymidylate kinase-like domain-containing protein n=1 Tax=Penstemon smallii TaxID=265156 RepID=A0ABD3SY01_9LAMI